MAVGSLSVVCLIGANRGKRILGDVTVSGCLAIDDFVMAATAAAIGRYCYLRFGLLMLALWADHHAHVSLFHWLLASLRSFLMKEERHGVNGLSEIAGEFKSR